MVLSGPDITLHHDRRFSFKGRKVFVHIQEDFLDRSLTLACLQNHVSTLCGDLIIVTGSEPRVQEFQRGA